MQNDNINSKERLMTGISKVAAVIRPTYGAAGSNVIIEEKLYPYHSVRNDGKMIVDSIKLSDPIENMGANIVREIGDKADSTSGDGRKTTIILADAIFKASEGITARPMDIKRSLDEALPVVLEALDQETKPIEISDVKKVASIATENEELGQLIQEIYNEIGKDGIIEVAMANLPKSFYKITDGIRIQGAKMFGAYSTTEPGKAIYKNPKILISQEKITSVDQLEPIFVTLSQQGVSELVIFCEDMDMTVASRLALTHLQGGFKTLILKAPVLWKDWIFEDFSAITGAKPVNVKEGKTFKTLTLDDLGTCEQIIATPGKDGEVRVFGIKDIATHLAKIKELALTDDQQRLRLVWLQTKAAYLNVGGNSESELSYLLKKAKDGCSASFHALNGGVVQGGGLALTMVASKIPMSTLGETILRKALEAPYEQIEVNHGGAPVLDDVWDAATVVKNAVINAVGVAGIVLTAQNVITLPQENNGKMDTLKI